MAEDITKRVDQLREDLTQQQAASMTLLGIVQEIDKGVTDIRGVVRSMEAHDLVVDSRLNTIDNRQNAADVQTRRMWKDVQDSFKQVEATMATKQDIVDLNGKLDQVITLLTQKSGE